MANMELSKESILPPALANAALLIAAPNLGCLSTYTRALTDLCAAYCVPVPDLTPILQYKTVPSSASATNTDGGQVISLDTTAKTDGCLEASEDTIDL